MLIVTCIKQVPDTTQVKIDPVTGTLIREGVPSIINPFDAHALEESLRLKDRYGFKVVAISMGPPSAEMTLRKAIALGVDDAILLSDRAFGGADTLATSMVLASAIKKLSEEDEIALVLCGKQTIDGDTAQVGPGIAARLKFTQLTSVDKVEEVDMQKKRITVRCKFEGRYEILDSCFPAMIAVLREINKPRYPTVPMRLMADEATIKVWDNKVMKINEDEIGLKGSATAVRRIFSPDKAAGQILGGGDALDPEEAARMLINKLVSKNLISLQ
jgi:electron transfer flavoprotein beta subunit